MMVTENPRQFTMVRAVPLDSSGAFCATNVENKGESAMTTNPQKKRKLIKAETERLSKNKGEPQQHKQDKHKEMVATRLTPNRCERYPLKTHASPPDAMIAKDNKGTFKSV